MISMESLELLVRLLKLTEIKEDGRRRHNDPPSLTKQPLSSSSSSAPAPNSVVLDLFEILYQPDLSTNTNNMTVTPKLDRKITERESNLYIYISYIMHDCLVSK